MTDAPPPRGRRTGKPGAPEALPFPVINESDRHRWVRRADGPITRRTLARLRSHLGGALAACEPVYRFDSGDFVALRSGALLVRPRPDLTARESTRLDRELARRGLREAKPKSRYLRGFRYFELRTSAPANAVELRDRLTSDLDRLVADARLESVPRTSVFTFTPNDLLYPLQYNLRHVRADRAWDTTFGDPRVVIAVIPRLRSCPSRSQLWVR